MKRLGSDLNLKVWKHDKISRNHVPHVMNVEGFHLAETTAISP